MLFVVAYAGGWEYRNHHYDGFAKCLAAKQAKMYGLYWCPHCIEQKEMFGKAFQYVPYVECAIKGSHELTPECKAAGVKLFPSWQFGTNPPTEESLSDARAERQDWVQLAVSATEDKPAKAEAISTTNNRVLYLAIAILAVAGVVVSGMSLERHYAKSASAFCDFGERFNCDIVNRSEYSSVMGIPVAGIGIAGYGVLAALATVYRSRAEMPTGCWRRRWWDWGSRCI